MVWLLKLEIPSISEPMQLITLTKAPMYGYETNISRIIELYVEFFKAKQSRHCLQDYYASIVDFSLN